MFHFETPGGKWDISISSRAEVGNQRFSVTAEELNEKQVAFFSAVPFTGFRFFDTLNNLVIALESGTIGAIETDENVAGFLLAQRDGLARYNPDNLNSRIT